MQGLYPAWQNSNTGQFLAGSFETDGNDANPINLLGEGFTATVVASTTGRYLVTFNRKFASYSCVGAWVTGGTSDANYALVIAQDANAGTITIETQSAPGTEANLDGPRVSFFVVGLQR